MTRSYVAHDHAGILIQTTQAADFVSVEEQAIPKIVFFTRSEAAPTNYSFDLAPRYEWPFGVAFRILHPFNWTGGCESQYSMPSYSPA